MDPLADVVIDTVSVALAWPVIWAPVPAGIIPMALWARAQVKLASGDATDPGSRNAALQQLLLGSDTWQVQS